MQDQAYRHCRRCDSMKPIDGFNPNRTSSDGLGHICVDCRKTGQAQSAKAAVARAIKAGELVRPAKCESCGEGCKPEAHHEDYSKPLDVIWLCKPCHGSAHGPREPIMDAKSRAYNITQNQRRRDKIRQWELENATPCKDCGSPIPATHGKERRARRCQLCFRRQERERMRRRIQGMQRLRVDGYSDPEIAEILDIPIGTVRRNLTREWCAKYGLEYVRSPYFSSGRVGQKVA